VANRATAGYHDAQIMSGSVTLHRFDGADVLAGVAAQRWLDPAAPLLPHVALSGGRIARSFLSAAASFATVSVDAARKIQQTVFFWADERCVPPGDPESNFRLAKELLFDPLALSSSGIHRI
jgi:6-phosphogluconolactonase